MRMAFLLGISMIVLGITLAVQDKLEREYERGYADGMHSLSTRQVDNLCMKWWFNSDLKAAKKRACAK
jgi:hypothetical protein